MKRLFRKNQIIITSLAIMIVIAGYLNFTADQTNPVKQEAAAETAEKIREENIQAEEAAAGAEADITSFPDEDLASVSAEAESTADTETPEGEKVGEAVAHGDVDLGILICGTGVGISLAANKVEGIRAVVCSEPYTAKLSRQHNNTNILAFGARVIGIETAKMIVDEWLNAEFMGGKHERRVNMLMDIEKRKIHGDK